MEKCELPLPTTDAVEKKTKELDKAKSFEFTDKQIDQVMSTRCKIVVMWQCDVVTDHSREGKVPKKSKELCND